MSKTERERPRLYLITPPSIELRPFAEALASACEGGDVACLQLRLKDVPDEVIAEATQALMPIAQAFDVAFLINDDARLARELDVDGVHIGQQDTPYDEARQLLGDHKIVGVTCHDSRHLAMEAGEQGADYVAFGAFFASQTKTPKFHAELDLLRWWQDLMEIPCVAIGGITTENCTPVIEAGADFLAVAAGVWDYADGPAAAVKRFNEIIDETMKDL